MPKITAYKGFDRNLQCRGFQFEIGKTYTHEGKVEACKSGFHAIEGHPLEVFSYYAPGMSRFCMVEVDGDIQRHTDDSKIAASILTIVKEIGISDMVRDAVKWVTDRAKPEGEKATGDQSAASSNGYRSVATSNGDQSVATSNGYRSAASSNGYQSVATSNGDRSAAASWGMFGTVMAEKDGCALCAVERDNDWNITSAACGITGQDGINAGVWYRCEGGKLVPNV